MPNPGQVIVRPSRHQGEQKKKNGDSPFCAAWRVAIDAQRCQLVLQVLHGIASAPREMNASSIAFLQWIWEGRRRLLRLCESGHSRMLPF